jgi:general stress protein YciG
MKRREKMAGSTEGGQKARNVNLERNPNFYKEIGAMGGAAGKTGGFASEKVGADGMTGKQRAAIVGKQGGQTPRKKPGGLRAFKMYYEEK